MIVLGVFDIAYADTSGFEQTHDRRQNLLAGEAWLGQVGLDAAADCRQRTAKVHQAIELHAIPDLPVTCVIAVLFAILGVTAYGLKVAVGIGTDPNRSPGWRNHQQPDAVQYLLIADCLAVRTDISESLSGALPADARPDFGY